MWRLETPTGTYAIKQFANDVDMCDAATRTRLNATETVARKFAGRGIPALASLSRAGEHLQVIDNVGYLVFPWTDWKARGRNDIDQYHAQTVAAILARMHRADIHVEGLAEPSTWPLEAERVTDLLTLAQQRNVREATYMLERLDDILAVFNRQDTALATLSRSTRVSHGDLDHKNVVWSEGGDPLLIDWESARAINPTYETLLEALDWSGITAQFEHRPFEQFLTVYAGEGGDLAVESIPAAFDAILGGWINWMLYNVGRAVGIESLRQRAIGLQQIDLAVGALLRLEKHSSRLQEIAYRCAARGCRE